MCCKQKLEKSAALIEKAKEGATLYDSLVVRVMHGVRGDLLYTPRLVGIIARGGSSPSARGASVPFRSTCTRGRGKAPAVNTSGRPHQGVAT